MQILIRRYHFVLVILAPIALSLIGVFTAREHKPAPIRESLPPMEEVVPKKILAGPLSPPAEPPRRELKKAPKVSMPPPLAKTAAPPEAGPKRIAFTFDDGPHPGYTEKLLAILARHEVPAAFFIVGKQAQLHPDLVEKIFQDGHEIANHTYSHPDLRKLTDREIVGELDKTHALIQSITEQKMRFFRPPGGQYNDLVVREISKLGYTMALWSVLPQDHLNPEAKLIEERVVNGAANDGIVLLHSGIENTLAALPEIFQRLKERGFRFVPLSEIEASGPSPALVRLTDSHEKNPGH